MVLPSDLRPGVGGAGGGQGNHRAQKDRGVAGRASRLGNGALASLGHPGPRICARGLCSPPFWTCLTSQGPSLMRKWIMGGAQRTRTKWTHTGATLSQLQKLTAQPWNRGGIKRRLLQTWGHHPTAESPPLGKHFRPVTAHTAPEVKAE